MNIRAIHKAAIEIFKQANAELEQGNKRKYSKLLKEAFELEKSAAEYLKDKKDIEPTRSVLYRSAANLALLSKKYIDAKRLATEGLLGTPFEELKIELESIITEAEKSLSLIETSTVVTRYSTSETSLYNYESKLYLQILRQKAIELKIEETTNKFGGAIIVTHILDFLKNIQASYQNFAEVNFKKSLSKLNLDNIDSQSIEFKNSTKLLAVDLNFQSFGVSLVADDGVMEQYPNYSKEFREMRKNLFNNFKNDVLYSNYNDVEFQKQISTKYSDEERRKIYSPMISSFSKKNYTITLTENNYQNKVKVYKPVNKTAISLLKPLPKVDNLEENMSLTRTITEKIGSKNTTIDQEELTKFELNKDIINIKFDDKEVNLYESHTITIIYEDKYYTIDDDKFQIFVTENTFDKVITSYQQSFISEFSSLLLNNDLNSDDMMRLDNFTESGLRNW